MENHEEMSNDGDIDVRIANIGRDIVPVRVPFGSSVADALRAGNFTPGEREVYCDGEQATDLDRATVQDGDTLTLVSGKVAAGA